MDNRFSKAVTLVGNASQIIIAGSILAELYFKFRDRKKKAVANPNPNDDGDFSPSPQPLAA